MVALSNPYKVPSAEDLPMPLTNVDHSNFNWSRFAHTEYLLHPLVSNLSLEAQGAYMRLLAHSARQVPFGSLPADLDVLIGWLGVKFKKGGKDETKLAVLVAEVLNAGFTFCQDKRWYCNLLTDQLPTDENQAIEKAPNKSSNSKKPVDPTLSSKRSEAAAKSHETRRAKKLQSELQNDDAKIANLQNPIAKIANGEVLQNLQDAKIANDLQNGGIKGGDLDLDQDRDLNKDQNLKSIRAASQHTKDTIAKKFDVFWSAYPRKTDRKKALNAFTKINPSDDLLQTMLDAVSAWSSKWLAEPQYTPHPTTWLNGERWNDAPPPVAAKPNQHKPSSGAVNQNWPDSQFTIPPSPETLAAIKKMQDEMEDGL